MNTNSCIDIELRRIGSPISVSAQRYGDIPALTASRLGKPLEFRCGLVCTIDQTRYLRVEPEMVWLLPDNGFSQDVVVYSNVFWTID